jgi:hypothetical protein
LLVLVALQEMVVSLTLTPQVKFMPMVVLAQLVELVLPQAALLVAVMAVRAMEAKAVAVVVQVATQAMAVLAVLIL